MKKRTKIIPVLLSGGSGVRLWPVSRENYPKQFLRLDSNKSLLQQSLDRLNKKTLFADPLIICNQNHRFVVAEQSENIGNKKKTIILEPVGRNTAPAVAVASIMAYAQSKDSYLLITPTDHKIGNTKKFYSAIKNGMGAAKKGLMVTFGIKPSSPNTGYGYIKTGKKIKTTVNCFSGLEFVEKPNQKIAKRIFKESNWYWNSGIFLFKVEVFLDYLKKLHPKIYKFSELAVKKGSKDLDFLRIDESSFKKSPTISLDHAIMERVENFAIVPVDMDWNDVGSWSALWDSQPKDKNNNLVVGDVILNKVNNSYIHSASKCLVSAIGVSDLIIVDTEDAILVTNKDHVQYIKNIVEQIKESNRPESVQHRVVFRPWGYYDSISNGDGFQVKRILVNTGAKLSLQKHGHRAEHWVVVKGKAQVTCGKKTFQLIEIQSTYIPLGEVHRLENIGSIPLEIIEIQTGEYLGEDDIIRIEDEYDRS